MPLLLWSKDTVSFPLSFMYLWMAKKFKLKCKIHYMGEVSSQPLFCSKQ